MKASHIVLWLGFFMITAQIMRDWSTIKQTIFQGGLNFSGTAASPDLPPLPFGLGGSRPKGNVGQQIKQGETFWQQHGQANNCPPGFPPGYICEGM